MDISALRSEQSIVETFNNPFKSLSYE